MTPTGREVRLGLCGFTIGASEYFRRFRVVEVQQTFYEPPQDATLVRWRRQAPPGFEFTLKAWQLVTHEGSSPTYRRMKHGLDAADRELVSRGLLLGVVVDGGKPEYVQGDFLVRGLVGADPGSGTVAVGTRVEPGQVVRLHARDADSADRDLREALGLRRAALGGESPAGALVFTCNGRGRGMFGVSDHDAEAIGDLLDDVPAAGFFAAGEIGPVGGETFLHGFTATMAVFA